MSTQQTIINYLLKRGACSFSEKPLNDVDSLILSSIVYFQFEKGSVTACAPDEFIPLANAICGIPRAQLFGNSWLTNFEGDALLSALLASRRFMDLRVGYYKNDFDSKLEKQFAAISFRLPDQTLYLAFRGTDNSLIGWKEDFNLSFMTSTPGQIEARAYLEFVARQNDNAGALMIGGHSKGGNLAEYAALTCASAVYSRIRRVYNHDGPSFCAKVSKRMDDPEFRAKLSKTVPRDSIFGMLMEHRSDFLVVQAKGVMFNQHAPTNWIVDKNSFSLEKKISSAARILSETLTSWVMSYPPDKRQLFVDTVFETFEATGITNWSQIQDNQSGYVRALIEAAADIDPGVRTEMMNMLGGVFGVLRTSTAPNNTNYQAQKKRK